jgi:hypothetical protein
MPTPTPGESRNDFIDRCIPIVIEDGTAEDGGQAFAVCNSLYDQDAKQTETVPPPTNERNWNAQQTLDQVREQGRQFTKEEANYIQPAPPDEQARRCGVCTFYQGPDDQGVQHCQVVTGGIEWSGHSDLFIDAKAQAAAEQQNAGALEQATRIVISEAGSITIRM